MSNQRLVILSLAALTLSACATTERMYDGPERGQGDVALLIGMNPADPLIGTQGWASQIKSVDGRAVSGSGTKVQILPGQHELTVYCKRPGAAPTTDKYIVTVEAGAQYVIGVREGTNRCQFTDRKTKKQL